MKILRYDLIDRYVMSMVKCHNGAIEFFIGEIDSIEISRFSTVIKYEYYEKSIIKFSDGSSPSANDYDFVLLGCKMLILWGFEILPGTTFYIEPHCL